MSISTTVTFEPQLDKLRSQISQLVQQYADIVHAPKPFVPGVTPVPVSGKVIGAKELQLMVEASLDGWLTTGRFNALFEDRLAKFLGVQHLITVNSGSSANLVAFSTLTSPQLERPLRPGEDYDLWIRLDSVERSKSFPSLFQKASLPVSCFPSTSSFSV